MTYDPVDADDDGTVESDVDNNTTTTGVLDTDSAVSTEPVASDRSETGQLAQLGGHETVVNPDVEFYPRDARGVFELLYQSGDTILGVRASDFYRSTDRGQSWTQGATLPSAPDNVAVELASGTILVATESDGLQRSTDSGSSFSQVDTFSHSAVQVRRNAICETPDGTVLYGEYSNVDGETFRIRRSTDDGASWSTALSLNSDAGESWQVHSVQVDPKDTSKIVAYVDEVFRTYLSTDDGASFSQLWANDNAKPLNFMFFKNYIAWGQDFGNPLNWVLRLSRSDFYNGNIENIEFIGQPAEGVAWYESYHVGSDPDIWVLTTNPGDRVGDTSTSEASPTNSMMYAVHDDGGAISPMQSWARPSDRHGTYEGRIFMPRIPHYNLPNYRTFISVLSPRPRGQVSIPTTVTKGSTGQQLNGMLADALLPNNTRMWAVDSTGTVRQVSYFTDTDHFRIGNGDSGAKSRYRDNGAYWLNVDGSLSVRHETDRTQLMGRRLDDVDDGASNSLGFEFSGGAGLYVDGNGEIVAVDESGNETIIS